MKRVLYWIPRLLCLAFAGFLSMFASDVFGEYDSVWKTALALFMHLIPTFMILIVLAAAWRREWIGAILFPILAIAHALSMRGRLHWSAYAVIDLPLVLLGVLFWINWRQRGEARSIARSS